MEAGVKVAAEKRGSQPQSNHGLAYACVSSESSPYLVLQALTFIIFICFTASISAYMAAALLEFFITLAFLFLYATQYYQRFDRLNWPCLVRNVASPPPILVSSFSLPDFPVALWLPFISTTELCFDSHCVLCSDVNF